ncbi:MAG: RnfABCDGE type electron transport complex subunit A [Clostridia bacterium]|jgi:electron transport complex protein RnfA|nr:RnfABCDGE type electron transport complex subunit A [Clostridia bacterium]
MKEMLLLLVGSALVNNFVLVRFLGICPFLGMTRQLDTALGMGLAASLVLVISAMASWLVNTYILAVLNLEFMQIVVFILMIACLVQLLEMVLRKMMPGLYQAMGIYLALITTNCAIMGIALLVVGSGYTFWQTTVFAIGAGLGFTLALVMMAGIREELEFVDVPPAAKGTSLALLIAGIMSMGFLGFAGLVPM